MCFKARFAKHFHNILSLSHFVFINRSLIFEPREERMGRRGEKENIVCVINKMSEQLGCLSKFEEKSVAWISTSTA